MKKPDQPDDHDRRPSGVHFLVNRVSTVVMRTGLVMLGIGLLWPVMAGWLQR